MSNKSSLLMRASLVAVLAAAPAAGAVFLLQSDLRRQGADAAREEALRQTRDASARIGRFVEGLRDALSVMAETPAVRNGEPASCTAMLTQLKARFGDKILLTANAADGWAVCSTAGIAPRSIRNGERSSHRLPLQAGAFAVGAWEPGSGPRSSGLHLGLPIQAEGGIGFAGTMTAAVEVARLADVLRPVPLPPGAELVLVDRNDRVVLRMGADNSDDLKPGDAVPPALMALLPALPATGVDADAEAGRLVPTGGEGPSRRLVALAPYVPGTDGALRLAVSYDPASLPVAAAAGGAGAMGMALGLGGLALALIVAFAGARILLSRPLAAALAAAAASGDGAPARAADAFAPHAPPSTKDGEALLALALETGNLGAWELDPATGALNRSESFDAIFGYGRPVDRWTWRGFLRHIVPEDRAAAEDAFRRLRAGPGPVAHEVRVYREGDGSLRTLHLRAVHQRAADGHARVFGVLADATDAAAAAAFAADAYAAPAPAAPPAAHPRAEGTLRLSPAELSHRVRGMFAAVQGIATETLRAPPGTGGLIPAAAKAAFETRLAALGRSHEVLMREDGAKADLSELVNLVLAPHAAGPSGARHTANGPALWVPAAAAVPLSVALHELATNAARHGALSQPNGSVAVTWRLEETGAGDAPMLRLRWEERGGPRLDGPPRRRGFGLRLLEAGLAPEIGGLVSVEFRNSGLLCEIEAPLKAAAPVLSESV